MDDTNYIEQPPVELEAAAEEVAQRNSLLDHCYVQRLDTKRLVKSDTELDLLSRYGVAWRTVNEGHAVELLKIEESEERKKIKRRQAGKLARKHRKRNAKVAWKS